MARDSRQFRAALAGLVLLGCASDDDMKDGDPTMTPPLGSMPGPTGTGGAIVPPSTGTGGAPGTGTGGMPSMPGTGGMMGTGGMPAMPGTGGMMGTGGMAGAGGMGAGGSGPGMDGVDPSAVKLTTVGANETIGLDWDRVAGATGYRVYWATAPGVTPATGQRIDSVEPAYVHRGLPNGTAHYYVVTSVLASGEGPATAEASATPGGEWVLEQLGAGDFDDIATGARVPKIPIAQRVHVLLLGEGYLASELSILHTHAAHNLDNPTNDVDRWVAEIFALTPYAEMKEAFVVWYLPRASSAHIGGGATAFGDDTDTASPPLFAALDGMGTDAFPFPLATTTKNYVASFLLFDPGRMRAGVSGHATSCRNPANMNQRISCAFGVGHAHEFTHAFSSVRDEYMENDNNLPQASETSNVSPSNRCSELPWAHLLEGAGINTTAGLVGAFGRPERGYHSEFLCLMNGTHDNGTYWCQSGDERYTNLTLRPQRLCNMCRELTAYSILRRTGVLPEMGGFTTWKSMYRMAFWDGFGFFVPQVVPQLLECNRNQAGTPVYEACVP